MAFIEVPVSNGRGGFIIHNINTTRIQSIMEVDESRSVCCLIGGNPFEVGVSRTKVMRKIELAEGYGNGRKQ